MEGPIERQTEGLTSFDPARIEQFARDWETMFDRGDHRTMAAYYAADATLIGTHMATIDGRPAIERFWRAACEGARRVALRRTVHLEHAEHAGALGYIRGTVVLDSQGGPPRRTVRYVTLWRREADGVWRLNVDISSAAT